jgi:hypothetical protein
MIILFISDSLDDETRMFSFYDTFRDRFINLGDEQAWYSYEDFYEEWIELEKTEPIRLKRLLPDWAFKEEE